MRRKSRNIVISFIWWSFVQNLERQVALKFLVMSIPAWIMITSKLIRILEWLSKREILRHCLLKLCCLCWIFCIESTQTFFIWIKGLDFVFPVLVGVNSFLVLSSHLFLDRVVKRSLAWSHSFNQLFLFLFLFLEEILIETHLRLEHIHLFNWTLLKRLKHFYLGMKSLDNLLTLRKFCTLSFKFLLCCLEL